MNFLNRGSTAIGLQVCKNHIAAAVIKCQKKHCVVAELLDIPLPAETNDDAQPVSDKPHAPYKAPEQAQDSAQQNLSKQTASAVVVSAMPAQQSLTRTMEIKLKKEKEIDSVLVFQSEPLLPYPPEEAIVDKVIISTTNDGTVLTLQAVKQSHLEKHLEDLHNQEIEPEVVISAPLALVAFSTFLLPEKPSHFILYIGEDHICCVFAREGKLVAAQTSALTFESAKRTLDDSPTPLPENEKLERLQKEVNRILFSLMKQVKELQTPTLLVTGEGPSMGATLDLLLANIQKNLLSPEPPAGATIPIELLHKHAIAIGSALLGVQDAPHKVNFRQKNFTYPYPWKQWKAPLCLYLGSCLAATLALWFYQSSYIDSTENHLRNAYAEVLSQANHTHASFEKLLASKGPKNDQSENIIPLASLTPEEIDFRLYKLESELKSAPELYPLQPNVPRVSDVLAWLSTHPKSLSTTVDGTARPLIQLESFSYAMVKRPEATKKQEKYQVKVELEFSSTSPTVAREFHEALLAPNDFIDPRAELKWSSDKNKYKLVFFLKDKTIYP